jgi:integrase
MGALDLLGRTLAVERAVVRGANGRPDLGEPKSDAGRRTLAMPAALAQALAAHAKAIGVTAADPEALLFPAPDGGLLRYSNWLRRAWWPAMVTAGLGSIDVKTAQYRLGHSSPVLTLELYAQAVTAAERDASERVGARLMTG